MDQTFATNETPHPTPKVSAAVIRRLPRYFRYLRDLRANDIFRISSGELARIMGVTASQIRQDFNCFGEFGQQGYGYNVDFLYQKISEILGATRGYHAIIVGSGNMGRALSSSPIFEKRGVTLTALFDVDPAVVGKKVCGFPVLSMDELENYCAQNRVDIAVLTVPRAVAAETAERIAGAGVRGIWNFTNVELKQKGCAIAESVHMGDSLMQLCYRMRSAEDGERQ